MSNIGEMAIQKGLQIRRTYLRMKEEGRGNRRVSDLNSALVMSRLTLAHYTNVNLCRRPQADNDVPVSSYSKIYFLQFDITDIVLSNADGASRRS